MTWSFPIGRLLGSELRVHATFFLLLAWVAAAAYFMGGVSAAIENTLFILALFACVVAHEYGHALMARRYGIATPDITLLPIGGMARLERMPEKPSQEILVALAGPAVNVVIWGVLVLAGAETDLEQLVELEDPAAGFMGRLAVVNLVLVLFNMIPAFPMDGGRVFRALLATQMPRGQATRIAAMAGQGLAFAFGFLGLVGGNPLLILVAVFVFIAATAENSDVAMRELARNLGVRDAMITQFEHLRTDSTLDHAANTLIRTTQHEFPVLDDEGFLVGFLMRRDLYKALESGNRMRPVTEVMITDVPALNVRDKLEAAIDAMYREGRPAVGVTGPRGHLIGYITPENLGELMVVGGRAA